MGHPPTEPDSEYWGLLAKKGEAGYTPVLGVEYGEYTINNETKKKIALKITE